jgi:uncharacterized membrane protein YccF (DUF307 family)
MRYILSLIFKDLGQIMAGLGWTIVFVVSAIWVVLKQALFGRD